MDQDEKTATATKQVEAMTGFYIHLVVFLLVNALLLVVNWLTSPNFWWVVFPFVGWGIGVVAHGVAVFSRTPNFVTRWKQRKIEQLKARM